MKSIADRLPPEIAWQVHPDWRKNEAEYWTVRDGLLSQYQGQWIGFADGVVIASGVSPVAVLHAAQSTGKHPFIICVGMEEEPCRIRRTAFPYNTSYPGEPGGRSVKSSSILEMESVVVHHFASSSHRRTHTRELW
jgi:hypothetical protein